MGDKKRKSKISRAFFSKWLEEREVIHYAEYEKAEWVPISLSLFVLILGISLSFFKFELGFLIVIIGGAFLLSNIYSIFYENGLAVTSRRIIILGRKGKPKFIYYRETFDIKIKVFKRKGKTDKKVLHINKKAHIASQIIEPGIHLDPFNTKVVHLRSIIRRAWKDQSPYALFNQKMKAFATANELKMTHLDFDIRNEFKLKGTINGLVLNLSLKNAANFKSLKMEITCKNEEDNFIRLRPEKSRDHVSKLLLGVQDYEINQEWFDDKFMIQSNYEPFVTYILSEKLLPVIHNAMIDLKGEIIMGNKADMEEAVNFDLHEEQILDAHLLGEKEIDKERRKNHNSSLIYTSSNLKYTDDFEKIAEDIILNINMLVTLAERINSYNNKN